MKTPEQYIVESQNLCAKARGYESYNDLASKVGDSREDYLNWTSCIGDATAKALKSMQEDHEKEIGRLKKALLDVGAETRLRYASECESVDWFNNNTPNVGISVEYQRHPEKPSILKMIDEALNPIQK